MDNKKYFFLHLTKTAGGSLKTALEAVTDRQIEFLYSTEDVERIAAMAPQQPDIVYGHGLFGMHTELGMPPNYVCVMRHPVMRTISHYYHLRNVEQGPIGDEIRTSVDINDFFARGSYWEFENFMCRIVSGIGDEGVIEEGRLFKTALTHINNHFHFVGIQEYLKLTILRLSELLGVTIQLEKRVNVGEYNFDSVSRETIDRIVELNKEDMALYAHCVNRFLVRP